MAQATLFSTTVLHFNETTTIKCGKGGAGDANVDDGFTLWNHARTSILTSEIVGPGWSLPPKKKTTIYKEIVN